MPDKLDLRECLQNVFEPGQARLIHSALVVTMEEYGELQVVADLVQRHHLGIIDGQAGLVLAEPLRALIDVFLEHRAETCAAAHVGRSWIDATKRNQPIRELAGPR